MEHVIVKARNGLSAFRVLEAISIEQRLVVLILLWPNSFGLLTVSKTQLEKLGDFHTLTRVKEFGFKASETSIGRMKASDRRVTNQHLMKVISVHMVGSLLQNRTEHA
jgi:hypothetical protein